MRQIHPETGESLVLFFKTLIQLYLLRLFIYSLTYCIKEGIEDNHLDIKWKMCQSIRQIRPGTGESLAIFQNTNIKLFFVCTNFWLTVSKRASKEIVLVVKFKKVLAYEAATSQNRGILWIFLKLLIKLYLFCLLIYCSTWCIKNVIRGNIFWD